VTTKESINIALKALGEYGMDKVKISESSYVNGLKSLLPEPSSEFDYAKVVRELRRQGLVGMHRDYQSLSFQLTPAGAFRLQAAAINGITINKPEVWDGKWRLLAFDVPLAYSAQRLKLTKHLNELGFFMLKRSLWLYPYPCQAEIEKLATHYNLWRYCSFMEIEKLDPVSAGRLERHFFGPN
jgi:hypothetical protein